MEYLDNETKHASRSFTPPTANDAPTTEQDIEKAAPDAIEDEKVANVQSVDEFEVWWDEPEDQDPENPQNWTKTKKWSNIAVLSAITFLTPLASSMFAPGVPEVLRDFHSSSNTAATFVVSIYILGFAFGPLLLAPLSELYGRVPVYNSCNVLFVTFTILCAVSQNMNMLMAFRFLAGFAGVATITCGSGTIVDMVKPEERGGAMAIWALGPIMGPVVGPIAGGYLAQAEGWRWTFWLITIAGGIVTIAAFFALSETYAPIILERKAARLRKETGNSSYQSRLASKLSPRALMIQSLVRPAKMLFLSPIVSPMCIYCAVVYGLLYILFTTFTFVFTGVYHFSTGSAGLAFIGLGVGTLIGLIFCGSQSDRTLKKKLAQGIAIKPEDRLPLHMTLPAVLSLPTGLFIYGWGAQKHIHWILPQIGSSFVGFGMISVMMCVQTYLVDAFPVHAASATAANAVLRSLLGACLPLVGLDLYDAIGLGWGNSLLAFLALVLAPIPILFSVFGERMRTSSKARIIS